MHVKINLKVFIIRKFTHFLKVYRKDKNLCRAPAQPERITCHGCSANGPSILKIARCPHCAVLGFPHFLGVDEHVFDLDIMIYFNTFGILVQFLGFTAHNGLLFIRIES
jgi:hypothetical protein